MAGKRATRLSETKEEEVGEEGIKRGGQGCTGRDSTFFLRRITRR